MSHGSLFDSFRWPFTHTKTHKQPFIGFPHSNTDSSLCLYDLWLLWASGPDGAQAEDEEDKEQYSNDSDYGDIAGMRERGWVWSLCWNHVGQVQHIAQRPACVTAFYLKISHEGNHYILKKVSNWMKILSKNAVYIQSHLFKFIDSLLVMKTKIQFATT